MDNGNRRKYDASQIAVLRTTSMRDILLALGYRTDHTPGGLFYSPFRSEDSPSFHIDDANHRWFDHGDMTAGSELRGGDRGGGDPISLVRMLRRCSFVEALDFLNAFNPSVLPHVEDRIISDGNGRGGQCVDMEIDSVRDGLQSKTLRDYAVLERRIPAPLLDAYVHQVYYTVTFADTDTGETRKSSYFAIGNRSVGGGWNLRYPARGKGKGKRAVKGPCDQMWSAYDKAGGECLSSVDDEGAVSLPEASSHNVVVFEGAMDFLSWMAWTGRRIPGDTDVVVLNSTEHVRSAMPFITAHANVIGYLDNDRAGDTAASIIAKACAEKASAGGRCAFFDKRSLYASFNDLNDAWRQESRAREEKALLAVAEEASRAGAAKRIVKEGEGREEAPARHASATFINH